MTKKNAENCLTQEKGKGEAKGNFNISTLCSWSMKQEFVMNYVKCIDEMQARLSVFFLK